MIWIGTAVIIFVSFLVFLFITDCGIKLIRDQRIDVGTLLVIVNLSS